MNIVRAAVASAIPASLLFAGIVEATGLPRMSFEQQVAKADAVVVATVWSRGRGGRPRWDSTGQLELTRMRVLRVLKGDPAIEALDLITRGSVAEHDPHCCEAGTIYILILRRARDNMFEVVNGHQSVIVVPRAGRGERASPRR